MNPRSSNPRSSNGRLPLLLVAGVLVACLIGVILVGINVGSGFGAVAYTVGDTKVSQQSVNDDLQALADNNNFALTAFADNFRTTPGAVDSTGAARWLSIEIYRQIASDIAAKRGERITDADRKEAVDAIAEQPGGAAFERLLRKLPDGLQQRLATVLALQTKLQDVKLGNPHVTVDPKYGFWSRKNGAVCPPTGCPAAAPTGADSVSGPGRITIVGLGPAGTDHLLPAARSAFEAAFEAASGAGFEADAVRFVRTARHPACDELAAAGVAFTSFDAHYDEADDLDTNYRGIVAALVAAAAEHGEVVYGVPGNPSVAERTVTLLHEAAARGEVTLRVLPGLSFADLAWARLGVDPMDGEARVVDGRAIDDAELAGPLLIAQCDNNFVVSDVKLALLEHLDAATPVTVLQRLGLPDEHVAVVPLEELDRGVFTPDHLTSLFVDAGAAGAARELVNLFQLARRLRAPGGCPWDAEQTHHSLTRYLLEESYEVVEALEALPADGPVPPELYAAVEDELGDLLFQVVFHAVIAQESGAFGMAEIARGIHDKLVRRHPHVFGDVVAEQSSDVLRNWEQIKKDEKGTTSLVEGITPGLPSLLYTHKLFRKAATVQLDPGGIDDALTRIDTAVAAMRADQADVEAALAEVLVGAVIVARAGGVDAESALRAWAADYRDRFQRMERLADAQGVDLATADEPTVRTLWDDASDSAR